MRLAIRPEAWRLGPAAGPGLAAEVRKVAYLGNAHELTPSTELGEIVVVSAEGQREWRVGDAGALTLPGRGVAVLA